MYHNEFARKPIQPTKTNNQDLVPDPVIEFGGGLSLGLAASLNLPASMLLLNLGGLLPFATCCLSIAAHRATEWLNTLTPTLTTARPSAVPVPHLRTMPISAMNRVGHRERMRASH